MGTLLGTNFLAIPLLVAALVQFLPTDPMITLGVLMVLLTPCIDYVGTFAHLGRADARLLLAATPALLIVQMLLLPPGVVDLGAVGLLSENRAGLRIVVPSKYPGRPSPLAAPAWPPFGLRETRWAPYEKLVMEPPNPFGRPAISRR